MFYTMTDNGDDASIIVYIPGSDGPQVASRSSHANFDQIVAGAEAGDVAILDLFDIGKTIEREFQRIGERVTVKGNNVFMDGDPVEGALQDQILDFLDNGENFAPLVKFWEKLATNPLGNVRDGLFSWIAGQKANGNFTITDDGDILGYKAVKRQAPEWRTDEIEVFVPSRRGEGVVNGIDVEKSKYVEQRPGDMVEMPRSIVLNAPSQDCGTGLHIGTWEYASTFMSGPDQVVMLVKFSPRDIVSLPDGNSSWKLRVCRYEVFGPVTEPLQSPVYRIAAEAASVNEVVAYDSDDDEEECDGCEGSGWNYEDDVECTWCDGDGVV